VDHREAPRRQPRGRDEPGSAWAVEGIDAEQTFEDGDCIVAEGGHGACTSSRKDESHREVEQSGDVTFGYIERGDFFGEMSLLESLPRYAGAFAVGTAQPRHRGRKPRSPDPPRSDTCHRDDATTERQARLQLTLDAGPRRPERWSHATIWESFDEDLDDAD
jgi:hypothetical protein